MAHLMARHEPWLRRLARAAVRRYRIDFEDAYADVLVGLWQADARHDPTRGPFKPFAYRVITRHVLEGMRQRGPHTRTRWRRSQGTWLEGTPGETVAEQMAQLRIAVEAGHAETAVRHDPDALLDRQRVRALVPRLGHPERDVIERVFLEGRSAAEVARELGTSRSWLTRLKQRGLAQLRQMMADTESAPDS